MLWSSVRKLRCDNVEIELRDQVVYGLGPHASPEDARRKIQQLPVLRLREHLILLEITDLIDNLVSFRSQIRLLLLEIRLCSCRSDLSEASWICSASCSLSASVALGESFRLPASLIFSVSYYSSNLFEPIFIDRFTGFDDDLAIEREVVIE